jgi:uncharacterized protein YegJ (DUF2314 family)
MFPKSRLSTPIPGGGALLRAGAVAAILAGLVASPTAAQTVTEKAERDETAIVAKSDPVTAAAMRKAQVELPSFLALSTAPKPGMEGFAVKVAIREGEEAEYFWIVPFTANGRQFSGAINNAPRAVHSVKFGETITFDQSEIVDWMYFDNGEMEGNYTACALLKSAPASEAEEFKQRFHFHCDF